MWKMTFGDVLVRGLTIDIYVISLFYSSYEILVLPLNYTEIVNYLTMSCDVTKGICMEEALRCSLNIS